ncbi:LamG domain-containing protein [Mangrovivirga sp. M17]|uniref:LamG domain-containing protein n=1 Tax=Mangrovivirga halotolerans TaxID=2993936 RepID=A0ABT3RM99_9BACT|nr:LamG domain-containing protein [Mangrovivirga halotolerans]MCX2742680.1 LamG domain-containing protein [Mangrovivirga halotolerans]
MRFKLLSKGLLALIFISVFSIITSCKDEEGTEPKNEEPEVIDIPRNGLVAFYPFNGNANDESGVGDSANGSFSGTPNPLESIPDRYGNPNSAYKFEETNSIEVINFNKVQILGDFSLSGWVKCVASGEFISTSRHYLEFDQTTNEVIARISEDATNSLYLKEIISNPGEWHFICSVWDEANQTGKLYVDGNLAVQENATLSVKNTTSDDILFGVFNFSGAIDDIAIYNEALTAAEVKSLYNQTVTK